MLLSRAFSWLRHITDLRILNDDYREAFIDFVGWFVKRVGPDIGKVRVKTLVFLYCFYQFTLDFSLRFNCPDALPACANTIGGLIYRAI